MELESKRLYYRPLTQADACDLFRIYSKKEVVRWLNVPYHVDVEETLEGIRKWEQLCEKLSQPMPFVIVEKKMDRIIGTIDLHHPSSSHTMEIGYLLDSVYWHQGYMQEALRSLLDYGFQTLDLHRINAWCAAENKASSALLKRTNFLFDGELPHQVLLGDGRYHTMELYTLMREDWRNQYEKTAGSQI